MKRKFGSPHDYVGHLSGWQRDLVTALRDVVRTAADFEEAVKWGHLVYTSHGPALLIRAEEQRVLVGFWRGQRLRHLEPRLQPGGKYEMATLTLREADGIELAVVRSLAESAAELNAQLGDPRDAARS